MALNDGQDWTKQRTVVRMMRWRPPLATQGMFDKFLERDAPGTVREIEATFGDVSSKCTVLHRALVSLYVSYDFMTWHWWVTPRGDLDKEIARGIAATKDDACKRAGVAAAEAMRADLAEIEAVAVPWKSQKGG